MLIQSDPDLRITSDWCFLEDDQVFTLGYFIMLMLADLLR